MGESQWVKANGSKLKSKFYDIDFYFLDSLDYCIEISKLTKIHSGGEYVINMTPEEYKIFQENQKKQPAAPEAAAPDDSSISVTQDPSKNS